MDLRSKNYLLHLCKKSSNPNTFFLFLFCSWAICAFGQPAFSGGCSFVASICGYALFWYAIDFIPVKKWQVVLAIAWYFSVSCVQLSWMLSFEYQGAYIIALHFLLSLLVACQFGVLQGCRWLDRLEIMGIFALCSTWTLLEWMRIFLFCGFTWNPVGLSMGYSHYSLFLASVFGVYGLSFWVMLTNSVAFLSWKKRCFPTFCIWIFCIIFPFLAGYLHEHVVHAKRTASPVLSAALIQTSLFPEEKDPGFSPKDFVYPLQQWMQILDLLQENKKKLDIIALPEVAIPFGANRLVYRLSSIEDLWESYFGRDSLLNLPKLPNNDGKQDVKGVCYVSNAYVAQALSSQYQAEVIIGLDQKDPNTGRFFNAAFHFTPDAKPPSVYYKCVLVPGSEYMPFSWCRDIAKRYGIQGVYQHGKAPGVFLGKIPLGISICYEETYSFFLRKSREMGAQVFVNLSNDAWFPNAMLPWQHFDHGKVRGVENGVAVLRATNTGLTAAVDAFGKVHKTLPFSTKNNRIANALFVQIPTYCYPTIYTYFGDFLLISIASISVAVAVFFRLVKSRKWNFVKALVEKIALR